MLVKGHSDVLFDTILRLGGKQKHLDFHNMFLSIDITNNDLLKYSMLVKRWHHDIAKDNILSIRCACVLTNEFDADEPDVKGRVTLSSSGVYLVTGVW